MREEPVDTIEYRGKTIKIYQDETPEDPREWDNLGTMVCWNRRHNLGDVKKPGDHDDYMRRLAFECGTPVDTDRCDMSTIWKILDRHYLIMPLGLLDHSGLHMWVGGGSHWSDSAGWDSGTVGYIYVSHKKIREEWSVKCVRHKVKIHHCGTKKAIDYAKERLVGEVETYDQYLTGDVYGYVVEGSSGEDIGSCWGYFGHDWKENGLLSSARSEVDCHISKTIKDHLHMVMTWIKNRVPLQHRKPLVV